MPTYMHTYIHAYMHAYIHACMHAYMHALRQRFAESGVAYVLRRESERGGEP